MVRTVLRKHVDFCYEQRVVDLDSIVVWTARIAKPFVDVESVEVGRVRACGCTPWAVQVSQLLQNTEPPGGRDSVANILILGAWYNTFGNLPAELQEDRKLAHCRGSKAYVGIRGSYVLFPRVTDFIKEELTVFFIPKPHSVDDKVVFLFQYPPGQRKAVVVSPLESLNRVEEVYNPEPVVQPNLIVINGLLARAAASREHGDADRVELVELRQDLGENRSPLKKEETLQKRRRVAVVRGIDERIAVGVVLGRVGIARYELGCCLEHVGRRRGATTSERRGFVESSY